MTGGDDIQNEIWGNMGLPSAVLILTKLHPVDCGTL